MRVTFPTMGRLTGTLVRATGDTVVVNLGESVAHLGTRNVRRLEVSRGYRREILRDAAIGFAVGLGLGAAFTAGTYANDICPSKEITGSEVECPSLIQTSRSERLRRYTIPVATFSTLLGGLVGNVGREHWSTLTVGDAPRRVGLLVERAGGRQQMGVAMAF